MTDKLLRWSPFAACLYAYVLIGGIVSLAGWILDMPRLTDWYDYGISIQPNAAIATMAAGACLVLLSLEYRRAAAVLGGLVTFLGASVLFEYLSAINLGIDSLLLFHRTWGSFGVLEPGRMGPPGAMSWTLIGAALLLSSRPSDSRSRMLVPFLGLLTGSMATLSLTGYLYGASTLYTLPTLTVIALQTATFIFVVSLCLIFSVPEFGPMRLLGENTPAGMLVRRIGPALIVVPILLGFLELVGAQSKLYDSAFGSALRTVAEIGLLLMLLWRTGAAINRQNQERKQAELALEKALERETTARAEAERTARLKDDFLATLSHELRTPLNAILGWSQFLKKDMSNPEKARTAVEVIERNGRLQLQLITDLLDMSRVLSGKMRLDVQRVEIPLAVESAIESMLPAAEAKGVRIEPTIEPHPGVIAGDPGRVQQIVWNLLSNAVKFTPRGGCVQVKVARKNQHVEVRVIDTGEGISPSFLPHIFERFRQADASPSRPYGGLGIGLALVKQLVELHGGRVRATSDGLGKGATFVVELPIPAALDGERNRMRLNPWAAAEVENRLPAHLQGINILVVEDEPDAQAMLRRVLEECQAAVSTALSSDHAFEILECERFDVIVSDIGMPGVDGYAFITKVRDRGIQTPAVALTAFARDEDRARAMSAGFQAHVSKPLVVSELFSVIACLVRPTDQESARCAG